MARTAKGAKVIAVFSPPRVKATMFLVQRALAAWSAYCEELQVAMHTPGAEARWQCDASLRGRVAEMQAGYGIFSRYQAAFEAWKRKAKWATEERLEADAKLFVDFVNRQTQTIAPVVSLTDRRAVK